MASAGFKSVVEMFHHRVRATPDAEAMYYRRDGAWQVIDWRAVGARARAIACGLRALGLRDEQRVAIVSGTRMEWILADMGILCAGGATTTVYPTNTAEECAYIVADSGARFAFAENVRQVEKLRAMRDELPELERVVILEGKVDEPWVMSLDALERAGLAWDAANPGEYERVSNAVGPDHLATLIYTSGTTGPPKGVMLTHDNWVYEGEAIDGAGMISPADKQFLFLPLAHSFAKVLEIAFIRIGVPTAVDGDIDALVENLAAVRPTFLGAVPRVFEKVYARVVSTARAAGGPRQQLFEWAMDVGTEVSRLQQAGKQPTGWLAMKASVADRLVFAKLKERFGGRVRFMISGGAPLSKDVAAFFHAAGMLVLEGYGLTESSAGTFMNRMDRWRFGTVGVAVQGTDVALADDGEVLLRGRGVMRGYYRHPEATAEALVGGWLHTGDIGKLEDGFLTITDRKKDLIKTSGGKYVAPQEIENRLKARSPLVSQVLVHGERRNYCVALVTVAEDVAREIVTHNGGSAGTYAEVAAHPRVNAEVARLVGELNRELASYESIKKFAVLPEDFTIEGGELTPTLKVKRKVVEQKYVNLLDGFYEGAASL